MAVAVAGAMRVPIIGAGVLSIVIGVLTPGIDVKTPETGSMTGILR